VRRDGRPADRELFGNSVRHSRSRHRGGIITVLVTGIAGGFRVEVTDEGGDTVPALIPCDTQSVGGRGLMLVDGLAARWDYYPGADGTVTTWFEMADLHERQAHIPGSSQHWPG